MPQKIDRERIHHGYLERVGNSLRSKRSALKLEGDWGGGFHTPIPTKNTRTRSRLGGLVSSVGQKKAKETDKEIGKTLTTMRTKSPLEIKISMEESSNCHGEDLGAESHMRKEKKWRENCFWREGGHRSFLKTDKSVWLVWPTGLTNLH
jgi:hypothetical protein